MGTDSFLAYIKAKHIYVEMAKDIEIRLTLQIRN